jgi:hypothetical protein
MRMRPAAHGRFAALAASVCAFCVFWAAAVGAQNEVVQRKDTKTGKAGHEVPLGGHVRIDRTCASIGLPQIDVEKPPAHGVVCLRPADVSLNYLVGNAPTQCLGKKAAGVRIIYRPHDGYVGKDAARYIVRFPHSQVNVDVDVTVVPDDRPQIGGVSPVPGAANQDTQKPGRMPDCAALES